ncbi:MAG TPA: hypothetical protein VF586_02195 [Pyrinomonadaceae bacterium]
MPSPKNFMEKIERMINAWRTMAPQKSFGGMTLSQFQEAAEPSRAIRQRIEDYENLLSHAIVERDNDDDALNDKVQLIVAGILADPTEGPDSPLYEAFGYTRKSERKTGLTRKRKESPQT